MNLSIVVVNYHSEKLVAKLRKSLKPAEKGWEFIVVDNSENNRGFSRACNFGAKVAKGDFLLFLNPDTLTTQADVEQMLTYIRGHKQVGILGPQLLDENNEPYLSFTGDYTKQNAPVVLSFLNKYLSFYQPARLFWKIEAKLNRKQEVEQISGAAMLLSKKDFQAVGGFDERFFLYFEDADLCRRIRATGKKIWFFPKAKVYHQRGGATDSQNYRIKRWFRASRFNFFKKYEGWSYAVLLETFLTIFEEWRFLLILMLAGLMRFVFLPDLSPLIGDQAKDYLFAYEQSQRFNLPLLGIESSLPRFHQGPVFVWMLMLIFSVFGLQPDLPVYAASVLGISGIAGVYLTAREFLNEKSAYLALIILAASPLAVLHARLAFMTAPVLLVSAIFLYWLYRPRIKAADWFWPFFGFSLLFQFELSYFPLILLPAGLLLKAFRENRRKFKSNLLWSGLGLTSGLWPQIFHDFTHRFDQVGVFLLWVGYRILKAFGLGGEATLTSGLSTYADSVGTYLGRVYVWGYEGTGVIVLIVLLAAGFLYNREERFRRAGLLISFILVLLVSYLIHGSPSEAYFPALMAPTALLTGWVVSFISTRTRTLMTLVFIVLGIYNAYFLLSNDFLLYTEKTRHNPDLAYYGLPLYQFEAISAYFLAQSGGQPIALKMASPTPQPDSLLDPYRFLILAQGGRLAETGYSIYLFFGGFAAEPPYQNMRIVRLDGLVVGLPL